MTDNERELLLLVARMLGRMSFGPPSDEKASMLRLVKAIEGEKATTTTKDS